MKKKQIDWPSRGHSYSSEEIGILGDFLSSENTSLSQSNYVIEFEEKFNKQFINKSSIALMSAAHAIDLIALKIRSSTEKRTIICPAHTYCASALGFLRAGFNLVFVDIDPEDFTISLDSFYGKVDLKDLAGIIVVHLYGKASKSSSKIRTFCDANDVYMVEDCAQALGATYNDDYVGQLGDFACFSFHSQKNITTLGEGGMLVVSSSDEGIFKELRINGHKPFLRENNESYWLPAMVNTVETIGGVIPIKSTLSESQALIGSLVLDRYSELQLKRKELVNTFFSNLECVNYFKFQEGLTDESHARHLLPFKVINYDRDKLISVLFEKYNIKAIVQYYPLNRYHLFKNNSNVKSLDLENTNDFFDNMISLPFSSTLKKDDMIYMAKSLNEILC